MEEGDWYRQRGYAHFDRPPSRARAVAYVTNQQKVSSHAFFPLVMRPIRTFHMKEGDVGRRFTQKTRAIAYAAHMDTAIHAYYASVLTKKLEERYIDTHIGDAVLAYRRHNPPKCNVDFAFDVFQEIQGRDKCDVIALDIEAFFDSMDHKLLKAAWQKLLGVSQLPADHFAVFKSVTNDHAILWSDIRKHLKERQRRRAGRTGEPICEIQVFRKLLARHCRPRHVLVAELRSKDELKNSGSPTSGTTPATTPLPKGIPQGTAISATLANLYMLDFDGIAYATIREMGGSYRRYSDDIAIIVPHGAGSKALDYIRALIEEMCHLKIKDAKTERFSFTRTSATEQQCTYHSGDPTATRRRPFRYLGFAFDGRTVSVRDGTFSRFAISAAKVVHAADIAARRTESPMRLRKIYATKSKLGPGRAYSAKAKSERGPGAAPRPGFHNYLRQSIRKASTRSIQHRLRSQQAAAGRRLKQLIARQRPERNEPQPPTAPMET